MASFGGLLGVNGGQNGTGVSSPRNASIVSPVTQDQADLANAQANYGVSQQGNLASQLLGGTQNAIGSQDQLLAQLQAGAQGQGPNPALAQLNQTTGANVANQAALMAGQRGSSANPALLARQAAMQGAATQQQAVGQGATLAAQQQIAQEQALQAQQAQMLNQQQTANNAYNQAAQGNQTNLLNSIAGVNNANVSSQGGVNAANAGLSGQLTGGQLNLIGNLTGAAGSAATGGTSGGSKAVAAGANGGQIQKMANGGPAGPMSRVGQYFANLSQPQSQPQDNSLQGTNYFGNSFGWMKPQAAAQAPAAQIQAQPGNSNAQMLAAMDTPYMAAEGGKVPVMLSPGERVLTPDIVAKVVRGEAHPMVDGKVVPGKPKVGGAKNSYANDTFKTAVPPGTIIEPRSVTQSKDADKKSVDFVHAVLAKKGNLPKKA